MEKIIVHAKFHTGHRQPGYPGVFRFVHGHTWRGTVTIATEEFPRDELDMSLDFGHLKKIMRDLDHKMLVTAHDAFQYFGRAYDLEVRGIQGISTDSEAGVRQVKELVDLLSERKIRAVFVETSVSDQNIRSLLEGCAARGHQVVVGGSLFSDAMGKAGTAEGTYEGMVKTNVDTIVQALK